MVDTAFFAAMGQSPLSSIPPDPTSAPASATQALETWLGNAWDSPQDPDDTQAKRVAKAYQHVFATEAGHLILMDMARYTNTQHTSFVPGDPHLTSFHEGQRDAFLHLLALAQNTCFKGPTS